ncbi:MAG: hypothetical protein LBM75_00725 [Myxococcales bacterium]|jgi:hypothetical protein|nr:hypothetical protein [Myxococcales bacterium]
MFEARMKNSMKLQNKLRESRSQSLMNEGFPEFSEMPEFHQFPQAQAQYIVNAGFPEFSERPEFHQTFFTPENSGNDRESIRARN